MVYSASGSTTSRFIRGAYANMFLENGRLSMLPRMLLRLRVDAVNRSVLTYDR